MKYITQSPEETLKLANELGKKLDKGDTIALNGELGAGKTVIAKGIAQSLNIVEDVTSPTYNIVCEYSGRLPLYHMDLYRISDYDEFEMLGVDHLLFGDGITLIEWSDRIIDELSDEIIIIDIAIDPETGYRVIDIKGLTE